MLPYIKFNISTNGLGQSQADIQKTPGLLVTGVTVTGDDKVFAGESYQIFSLQEAKDLGIEASGVNSFAYKHIKAFYDYAGENAELWFMLITSTMKDALDKDIEPNFAKKLISDAAGKIRVLGVVKKFEGTVTPLESLDKDVIDAVEKAQELADYFTGKYMPFRVVLSGNAFTGNFTTLKNYSLSNYNRVSILLSNTDGQKDASVGLALGRLASTPVQRNIGRVRDGAVENNSAYFTDGSKVESLSTQWSSIDGKGYIFLQNYAGRSGFYFSDDVTLTKPTDDFKSLANGFVMDKAMLIAYDMLLEFLKDEVPVNTDGTIHPSIIKSWQSAVDTQIRSLMVEPGNLSDVNVNINPNQNVVSTGEVVMQVALLPVGYAKYITVNIGFTTNAE
ncbi:DUF2586 family protein [Epilithonimonas zeae]|uniref:DUF2586 family protein n=1 Tax=Epilithonimonas zeae TaxID=1416779 RepID=A0A1N6GWI6_9FLAO|nr:DUF2586 family protein [Epilithonimonas zeae]SIO11884.1 hypothetical protein SAMN05444409_2099 [Epilithonimonas zeae]